MITASTDADSPEGILRACRAIPAWEWMLAGLATLTALLLGLSRLSDPSLWHDELIHVFVAKGILDSGFPLLPSGNVFTEGTLYNYLLAGVVLLFGDGEAAVRTPSVIANAVNVLGTYFVVRRLLGAPTALVAAFALALSPWSLAWSRQARFYALQQTMFLATLYAVWRCGEAPDRRGIVQWGLGACGAYALGLLSGPHSVFFLAPIGVYAGLHVLRERRVRSRWFLMLAGVTLLGVVTVAGHALTLPQAEYDAIFKEAQIGGPPPDPSDRDQSDSLYYFRFFTNNLLCGVFFAWLVLNAAIGFNGVAGRLFNSRPLQYVGQISYGLYLVHNWMPKVIERLVGDIPRLELGLIVIPATFVVCILSWHFFEQPILRLRRRFAAVPAAAEPAGEGGASTKRRSGTTT